MDKRKHKIDLPRTLEGLKRVQSIKILGVALTNGLSVTPHIQHLVMSNAQVLYALKILRAHGLCDKALQAVFRSVVLARLLYASPAWWGFAGTQDRKRFKDFYAVASVLVSFHLIYPVSMSYVLKPIKIVQQGFKQHGSCLAPPTHACP